MSTPVLLDRVKYCCGQAAAADYAHPKYVTVVNIIPVLYDISCMNICR